jgi:hypothetical protein
MKPLKRESSFNNLRVFTEELTAATNKEVVAQAFVPVFGNDEQNPTSAPRIPSPKGL